MARYSSVKDILAVHGEKNVVVQHCVFVSLGGIMLESDKYNPASPGDSGFAKDLIPELVKAVAAHPNVSAPVTIAESSMVMTLNSPKFLVIGSPYLFHLTLPKPRQKYVAWSTPNDIEDFYAIYSGSLFAVFREIPDYHRIATFIPSRQDAAVFHSQKDGGA